MNNFYHKFKKIIFVLSIFPIIVFAKNKEFKEIVVFGDSLSDAGSNGRFIPLVEKSDNYADIISQTLTSKRRVLSYTKSGSNYAISGALIDFKNPLSFFVNNLFSINEQTHYYLEHNIPSKENIYFYWAGGWDIYFNMIFDSLVKISTEFTFNSYPNYNNPLINLSKDIFLNKNTQSLISQIRSQFDNNAKYVAVLNIPNSGYAPAISFFHFDILSLITMPLLGINFNQLIENLGFNIDKNLRTASNNQVTIGKNSIREFGVKSLKSQFWFLPDILLYNYWDTLNLMAQFYTENYNNTIKKKLLSLSDKNIIYLDVYNLFEEVIDNPQKYGVTNLVLPACTFGVKSSTCYEKDYHNDANYFFGDWFHPNIITHMGIANYFLAVFNAPVQVSSILKQMNSSNLSSNLFVESNLKEFRFNKNLKNNKILPILGISGNESGRSYLNYANKNSYNNALNLGFIYNLTPKFSLGTLLELGFGTHRPYTNFNYRYNQENLSIFGQYLFDNNIWINSQIGIVYIHASQINRRINFIPMTIGVTEQASHTHGFNQLFYLKLGYDYKFNKDYILSPIVGYSYGYYKVKGYKEKGFRSTSMNFNDFSKNDSYIFTGLEFNVRKFPIKFSGQVTYNQIFNKDPIKIKSSINTISNKFERDIYLSDKHWVSSKIGLLKTINKYNFSLDIEYRNNNNKDNQINYSIGINKIF